MKPKRAPIMGWSSWNHFRQNINESVIYETAQAMKDHDLLRLGYQYVNMDDCWQSSSRDAHGQLQFDLSTFPSGKKLIDDLHQLGLKVGLYSSCGRMTCEDLPASYGNEEKDAQQIIDFGADFLKYDYCHVVDLRSDEAWLPGAPAIQGIELFNQETKITYYLSAEEAECSGQATLTYPDNSSEQPFITGIAYNQGSFTFKNLNIPAGSYVITVVFRKQKTEERLLATMALNHEEKVIHFPTSSGWSLTGRVQFTYLATEPLTTISLTNPVSDQRSDAILRYKTMYNALQKALATASNRDFVFSVCEHGRNQPWLWAPDFAEAYRIFPDIENSWESVLMCYDQAVRVSEYAKPGSYADPDMLEVGNGRLTNEENKAHFSLWCFMSAPLILGNDLRQLGNLEDNTLEVITNQQLIQINQSKPYLPAKRIQKGDIDILAKYTEDGAANLCFLNRSEVQQAVTFDLKRLPHTIHDVVFNHEFRSLKELWHSTDYQFENDTLDFKLAPHEVKVFKLTQ